MHSNIHDISVRCIVERALSAYPSHLTPTSPLTPSSPLTSSDESSTGCRWSTLTNTTVSLPSDALFCDLEQIVLRRLGYKGDDVTSAKGYIQLCNWKELELSCVTSNADISLGHVFGKIKHAVTLRFKLPKQRPDKLSIQAMSGKLFELFLAKQIDLPFEKDLFGQLMKGEASMTAERSRTFNKWTDDKSSQNISPAIVKPKLQRWFQSNEDNSRSSSEERTDFSSSSVSPPPQSTRYTDNTQRSIKTERRSPIIEGSESSRPLVVPVPILPNRNAIYTINPMLNRDETDSPFTKRARSSDEDEDANSSPDNFNRSSSSSVSSHPMTHLNSSTLSHFAVTPSSLAGQTRHTHHHAPNHIPNHATIPVPSYPATSFPTPTSLSSVHDMTATNMPKHEVEDLSMPVQCKRDRDGSPTSGPLAGSSPFSAALYMEQQRRQMHMLQMAQFAQLNYINGSIGAPATATHATSAATPTTPISATPSTAALSTTSTSGDPYEQRSLTPCSSNDEKMVREDSMSAKKRSRVFIDPLTEIPKLEVWFMDDTHPSSYMIDKYTEELNKSAYRRRFPCLEAKNVQLWFKNHRAKVKRSRQELKAASDMISRSLDGSSLPVSSMTMNGDMSVSPHHRLHDNDDDNNNNNEDNNNRGNHANDQDTPEAAAAAETSRAPVVCRNSAVTSASGHLQVVAAV